MTTRDQATKMIESLNRFEREAVESSINAIWSHHEDDDMTLEDAARATENGTCDHGRDYHEILNALIPWMLKLTATSLNDLTNRIEWAE